ncbi:MAG: hypothetical protein COA58_15715 [Bacteroidetes bacterium]|nr:MAG: hypothetical protein COA58_15715 [Bacteroidota bacterium]
MLEMRPICENCAKPLFNESDEAMICTFECTFCHDCVTNVLQNVCPNCGGGFSIRPTRPNNCITKNCVSNYPLSTNKIHKPIDSERFKPILRAFVDVEPRKR